MTKTAFFSVACSLAIMLLTATQGMPCTGLFAQAEDGGVVYARSMEFTIPLKSSLLLLPRGTACTASLPKGTAGAMWKTKYGIVGMNAFGSQVYVDGMNEKGLQMGLYWFSGYADYAGYDPKKAATTITPWDIGKFVLGQCASVKEARELLQHITLVAFPSKELGGTAPTAHFLLLDASGDAIAVEPLGQKLVIRDNPVGVFTNNPTFDWHLTNLNNYVNLRPNQVAKATMGKLTIAPLGMGIGMRGLPGDITPPSRFVRGAFYLNSLYPLKTTSEALAAVMRLHQTFFITKGIAHESTDGSGPAEITQWEMYTDLKNHKLYYRTYDNLTVRMIDAAKLDYSPGPVRVLSIDQAQKIEDMTSSFK